MTTWHLLDEDGFVLCNPNLLQMRVCEIDIETTTCAYCRLKWFHNNQDRIPERPPGRDILIHWDVREKEGEITALCGRIYNGDQYHICASKDILEVNCNKCRRNLIPITLDRLNRSLYRYSRLADRGEVSID